MINLCSLFKCKTYLQKLLICFLKLDFNPYNHIKEAANIIIDRLIT